MQLFDEGGTVRCAHLTSRELHPEVVTLFHQFTCRKYILSWYQGSYFCFFTHSQIIFIQNDKFQKILLILFFAIGPVANTSSHKHTHGNGENVVAWVW